MDKSTLSCLGRMTYGIYVLTSCKKNDEKHQIINGMIASWVSQVSYEPPLLMAAVHPNRYSHSLLKDNPVFGLNILDQSEKNLLKRFKGPEPLKKFENIAWYPGKTGVPILNDCIGWMELEIIETLAPGNHTLFIGQIIHSGFNQDKTPLSTLDYEGCYTGRK